MSVVMARFVRRRPAALRRRLVLRRPAARASRSGSRVSGPSGLSGPSGPSGCLYCPGLREQPCRFSTLRIGERARVHPDREQTTCALCSAADLEKSLKNARCKGLLTSALAFFAENDDSILRAAQDRIREFMGGAVLKACMSRLRKLQQRGGTKAQRARNAKEKAEERRKAAAVTRAEQWAPCLSRRKAQMKFDDLDGEDYRLRSTSAARALKRKFPVAMSAPTTSWQSPLAAAFTRYACFHSWQMCSQCQRMTPVKFRPALARAKARPKPLSRACRYCQKGIGYWAPSPADVPKPLRRLAQPLDHGRCACSVSTSADQNVPMEGTMHTPPRRGSAGKQQVSKNA